MIYRLADNITSPLGMTSVQNYLAVKDGKTGLRNHGRKYGVESEVIASLFADGEIDKAFNELAGKDENKYTRFEKLLILSISEALSQCNIDPAAPDTIIVLSTTKGNIEFIDKPGFDSGLGTSALKIAGYFGNPNIPLVVSNACISGVCAQITSLRLLDSGLYRNAIVAGCDVQSKFIISGFQSFKALSAEECKPFDQNRTGLNLGEAAATIIYTSTPNNDWCLVRGAIRNDANHISGPSRTGEGCYRALMAIVSETDRGQVGLINAHGTATPYNDEMESIALTRAGFGAVPVNGLKGYFGHTMGAAGILETIISMRSIADNTIIGTRGYEICGVSNPLNISAGNRETDTHTFIKMLSGFGGCNAAILMKKGGAPC